MNALNFDSGKFAKNAEQKQENIFFSFKKPQQTLAKINLADSTCFKCACIHSN